MSESTEFRSRRGRLACSARDLWLFATDINNFNRFVPGDTVSNWKSDGESCTFDVVPLGRVSVVLNEKVPFSKVVYAGDVLQRNNFTLLLDILDTDNDSSEVDITLRADLNPLMKMMISKPAGQFLEMMIGEMEKFRDWKQA
ncbi:MAG: hypothetical protein K0B05_12660 [Bacteroidales bacterium]|nr:hypothetical protein [Bacteroidales bacterium]